MHGIGDNEEYLKINIKGTVERELGVRGEQVTMHGIGDNEEYLQTDIKETEEREFQGYEESR